MKIPPNNFAEEDAVSSRGIVSGSNFELHKTESATGAKMGFAEADTVLGNMQTPFFILDA